jgi:hypothetical protein
MEKVKIVLTLVITDLAFSSFLKFQEAVNKLFLLGMMNHGFKNVSRLDVLETYVFIISWWRDEVAMPQFWSLLDQYFPFNSSFYCL